MPIDFGTHQRLNSSGFDHASNTIRAGASNREMVAALGLFIANYILKFFIGKSKKLSMILQGEKIILVHDGKVLASGMKQSTLSMDELERAVREHGVSGIDKVDLAVLEVDGNISILSDNFSRRTVKPRKKVQLSHNP